MCELSEMGRTFSAVVTSSTVTCNVSAVSISQAERESPVRLVWRNGPMNFTIESSTGADQRGLPWSVQYVHSVLLMIHLYGCIGTKFQNGGGGGGGHFN